MSAFALAIYFRSRAFVSLFLRQKFLIYSNEPFSCSPRRNRPNPGKHLPRTKAFCGLWIGSFGKHLHLRSIHPPTSTTVKSPREAGLRSIKVGFIRAWFAPLTPTRARSYRDACLSELWRKKQASHFMGNALYFSPSIVFSHEMIIIIVKGVGSVCPSY